MEVNPASLLDPSSYRVAETENPFVVERLQLGRNEFLSLLVSQLENQNPLEPMQDQEFVAQLATFSSLEQLIDLNARMDGVLASQSQMVNAQALNLIDREVLVYTGNTLELTPAGADEIVFDLTDDYLSARVRIVDERGVTVRSYKVDDPTVGRHALRWDGLDTDGDALPPGTYEFRVTAVNSRGEEQPITAFVSLPVEGIHIGDEGLALVSGQRMIDFSEILEIRRGGDAGTLEFEDAGADDEAGPAVPEATETAAVDLSNDTGSGAGATAAA